MNSAEPGSRREDGHGDRAQSRQFEIQELSPVLEQAADGNEAQQNEQKVEQVDRSALRGQKPQKMAVGGDQEHKVNQRIKAERETAGRIITGEVDVRVIGRVGESAGEVGGS